MKISSKARRELALIVLCLATLSLLVLLVFGKGGYLQVRSYRDRLNELKKENLELRQEHQKYREDIRKVEEDPKEIERIARKELNLAEPGDTIIQLLPSQDDPPREETPERKH